MITSRRETKITKTRFKTASFPRRLSDLRRIITLPVIVHPVLPFNFSGRAVNAVAIDDGTNVGIAATLFGMVFSQDEFEIGVVRFFGSECDAIQGNTLRINVIVLDGAKKQVERSVFM